jgi:malonyl-CoA O-methyltransferase
MDEEQDRSRAEFLSAQQAYDQWAAEYNDADPSTLLDEPFLMAMLQPLEDCRVLDLGCGTGRYLRLVSQSSRRVVGLDLSRGMLQQARRQRQEVNAVDWVQASVERLPFSEAAFDRVSSGLVLDHVQNLKAFFRGLAWVLKPGGRAVITAIHPEMQRLTGSLVQFSAAGREYRTQGTIHEVADILEAIHQAGLSVESLQEPLVDQELIVRRPAWQGRLGCPALLLLALTTSHGRPTA